MKKTIYSIRLQHFTFFNSKLWAVRDKVRKEIIYFFRKEILFPIYFFGVFLEYDISD